MSAILIRIFASGIVFGADKNVTVDDVCDGSVTTAKICKSKDGKILIGNIGAAKLGGAWALEEIKEIVDSHQGSPLSTIAKEVRSGVYHQRLEDDKNKKITPQIVNIAGYEERDNVLVPECWYISNCYELDKDAVYRDYREEFGCSDEVRIKTEEKGIKASVLRERLLGVSGGGYIGFQHSIDLAKFNDLIHFSKTAIENLPKSDPEFIPVTLEDQAKFVDLSLQMFSSYFKTYYPANQQFVGGGIDIGTLPWP
ncbi:MAG TPA: hypothetical protein EYN91_22475 [Candidatus Melainabacteria bacterium]|nr:hypothetical protein [Candidatus Melainabacteria bacterium]HIN63524.1 hypothetical protein [Candidatus Obscuribacterales bacterium]